MVSTHRSRPSRLAGQLLPCVLLGAVALVTFCSPVRQIRPLEPGEKAINVTLGGPVTKYIGDALLPVPWLSVGYNHGILKWLDVEGGIDLTHTVFSNPSIDIGANLRPVGSDRWRPALIVSPKFHLASNFDTYFRFYPDLTLTAAWNPKDGAFYPYLGMTNWWELVDEREDGFEQEHHWFFTPYVGLVYARTKWQYQVEMRVYMPNLDNDYGRAPTNWGFGDHGIIGFFIGIGRTFGGRT